MTEGEAVSTTEGRREQTDGRREEQREELLRRGERGAGEPGWTFAAHEEMAELERRREGVVMGRRTWTGATGAFLLIEDIYKVLLLAGRQ